MPKTEKREKREEKKTARIAVGVADHHVSRKVIAVVIAAALVILSFLIVRPYISALLFGAVFAFIFYTPYKKLNSVIKRPGVSAAIICFLFIVLLAAIIYFTAQITMREAFNLYMSIQQLDIFDIMNNILTKLFPDQPELARQITLTMQQALVTLTNTFIKQVGQVLTSAPQVILQLFVTFFVMFFFLKDGESIIQYIDEILPFSNEVNQRLVKRSKEVAYATIYGQILIGVIQGIAAGIGFYIFNAPSPLFFTLIAILLAILPFVGSWLVWAPLSIVLISSGSVINGILLLVYGIIVVGTIDDLVRPFIIGKRAKINALIVLIGMLGGMAFLGVVGLIVGPIILEYLFIFIELYRTGKMRTAF
ncbi:MAG: AI-2E family transporter [Candidatus Pacearchaeota archaeon]|nr:AI-2E family transporter [Candidatus Pacearchaeota archaeon]